MRYMSTDGRAPAARELYKLVLETTALKGWTKAELSERSGVARSTIDGWAKNPRPPQARSVAAVADVLGIDRAEAVRLAGIVKAAPDKVSAHLRRVLQAELPPDVAARVIAHIEEELVTGPGAEREEPESPAQAG